MSFNPAFFALSVANPGLLPLAFMGARGCKANLIVPSAPLVGGDPRGTKNLFNAQVEEPVALKVVDAS
jgi:hypothetical protein